ncbi:exonuclease RecJ [Hazenella coriacea]|uniref:Single-stranded-DNA-specific exonuclease RecJ n=1 Tax=Hazenella coriacea TaxID=1179467 RepID=A0A4R3L9V7_9BACL|nr:exonuclease RecJ [Hazenella coriacea]
MAASDPVICSNLIDQLGIHPTVAKMLVRRGLTEPNQARSFLNPKLEDLHDPFLLDGMKEAVERIQFAIQHNEKILIYGDYDADGVSSTSLLMYVFRWLQADVDYYIPNRFREGYGINKEALHLAKERGFQLVVSVDTGISAVEEAQVAKELGLDLIITDHHEPPEHLPEALAVINPKKPGCPYPCKLLAGVGVAFKLATALLARVPEELLEIVALGTIADLVPLLDENRIFATYGLKKMSQRKQIGITSLLEVSGVDDVVSAGHVGFSLGPRINASGRLDSANQAVELLLCEDLEEAKQIAEELNSMNRERQHLVEEMTLEAIAEVEAQPDLYQHVIVVAKPNWNVGVIGIVASRLVEKYYRPVIVLGIDEDKGIAKGSARSIAGFDLYKALTECKEYLPHYGGHYMAAGMTLPIENLPLFRSKLSQLAQEWLKPEDYIPLTMAEERLVIDQIDVSFIDQLQALAPYGVGNPTPLFIIENSQVARMQSIGRENNHLKLQLEANGKSLGAIGFRLADLAKEIAPQADLEILGELQMNEWNGKRSPQMVFRDISIPSMQVFDWRSNRIRIEDIETLQDEVSIYMCSEKARERDWLMQKSKDQVIFWERIEDNEWAERVLLKKHMVIVDPPPTLNHLKQGIQQWGQIERIYLLFGDADFDDLLVKAPSKENFAHTYRVLQRGKGPISISKHFTSLSRATGLKKRSLSFIIQVFEELEFIKIEQGFIHINPTPERKPLTESKFYQAQLAREEVLQTLVYSSYRELCQYLHSQLPVIGN